MIKRLFKKIIPVAVSLTLGITMSVTSLLPISFLGNSYVAMASTVTWPDAPEVSAPHAILIENSTGTILYEKAAKEKAYPASTTKLITTLLAIERCSLSDIISMSHEAIYSIGWDSSRVGLVEDEEMSLEDLLYAVMLASGNEACYAVAEHVGNENLENFLNIANSRVKELGCVNTNLTNPHGLQEENHYTCAYDLSLIMKKCIEYTSFRRISNNYYYTLPKTNKNGERVIAQTHQILRKKIKYDGVFAGKTGHTDEAGQCLVTAAERDGITLICVILGAANQDSVYNDTMALFDYGFDNFELVNPKGSNSTTTNAFPVLFKDDMAFSKEMSGSNLSLSESTVVLPKNADYKDVKNICHLNQLSKLSVGSNIIGTAEFTYADVTIGQANIIYNSSSEEIINAAEYYKECYFGTDEYSEEEYLRLTGIEPVREPDEPEKDYRPIIVGSIVGLIVAVAGLVIVSNMFRRKNM